MILLLCIVSLVIWAYIIAKARPGIGLVKLGVCTVCGFFFLYTVVSAGFFWADLFSFEGTLFVCVLMQSVAAGVLLMRSVRGMQPGGSLWQAVRPKIVLDGGRYWIPIGIALFALPFTWNKFELYSMGQDQGTYQVKALALMEYDTHNYMEMEEFTKLETPEERQKYLDFIYGQNNLYLPRVIEETETDASRFDKIVGTIHGLPTYSALLGLWGKIFGYAHMIGVQTVFYLCLIFLMYLLSENMGLKRSTGFWITLLTAFSPIVIWGSKSSLTEVWLAVIFAVFLCLLTGKRETARFSWIPLVVFAFSHISIYVFMPILVIVLFLMYLMDGEKGWLISVICTLAGYGISAFWSFGIAPYYSYGNYSVLWKIAGRLINEKNIKPVIIALCIALSGAALLLMGKRSLRPVEKMREAALGSRAFRRVCAWLIRLVLALSALFFIYKGIITAEYTRYFEYLQISTYIYMTGLLLIPFIYCYLFLRPARALRDGRTAVFVLLFVYCVIFYSSFMRLDVLFYYYYARYVTIFLSVVLILAGKLLEEACAAGRGRWPAAGMFALAFVTFLPYDVGLVTQKDHTRCEWEVLGDVCEDITSQDAFIVGPDEQQIVFIFPVKLLTGCDVYYADENLRGQIGKLALRYRSIYYLDYDGELEKKMEADSNWQDGALEVKKVYTNWNHLSYLDYFNISNPLTPIPLEYVEYRLKLSLHEISLSEQWEEDYEINHSDSVPE